MIIKSKNKNDLEEHIDLLDISRFIINEKNPNVVDISYIVSFNFINIYLQYNEEEEKNISVKVHELLIDYFYQTYRDFEQKANECF